MGVIERHRFIKMERDKESRLLTVNEYADALNCRIGFVEEGRDGSVENIQGNTLFFDETQAGNNRVIGSFEDEAGGRAIYFLFNSNKNHAIYKIDGGGTNPRKATKVISGEFLAFNPLNRISGVGVVGDLCYFTDGSNPQRVINLNRDYTGAGWKDILLHKIPPNQRPSISSRKTDNSRDINTIAGDNYRFAYRYVYLDNEISVFSPLSIVSPGAIDPPNTQTSLQFVEVTVSIEEELKQSVKKIEIAFIENNSGQYSVWETFDVGQDTTYTIPFYNDTNVSVVPDTDSAKITEPIPFKSRGLCVQESRVFLNSDLEGLDPPDSGSFTLTLNNATSTTTNIGFKEGEQYKVGVVFYDDRMRPTGVQLPKEIDIPFSLVPPRFINVTNSVPFENAEDRPIIKATLSKTGSLPSYARYYQLFRTKALGFSTYAQYPVNVLLFQYETDRVFQTGDGKRFVPSWDLAYLNGSPNFEKVWLQLPKSVPFVPDKDTFIRVKSDFNDSSINLDIEQVVDVRGDYVVVSGDFGMGDKWSEQEDKVWLVDVLKRSSTVATDVYYGCSDIFDIVDGDFGTKEVFITEGDTHKVRINGQQQFTYRSIFSAAQYDSFGYVTRSRVERLESPTPIAIGEEDYVPRNVDDETDTVDTRYSNLINYTMDYARSADSIGRPNVVIKDEGATKNNLLIRFSNTFIPNSQINGLSNFETLNQEQLPIQYSPLVSLVTVKNNIIAIHERHSNTIYTGEGFIKSADGADNALIQTDGVIGQTRELTGYGRLGTLHPESIVQHEGSVYWFDAIHGVAVEYTNQGAFPVSEVGMSNFFRNKSRFYQAGDTTQISGGYDPRYDEYILTFSSRGPSSPAETIAYNTKVKAWTSRYSYLPEFYVKSGEEFYSFKDGSVWLHNDKDQDYNNFYGQPYERRLTFYVNQSPNLTKVFTNIHLNAKSIANGTANFDVVELATEQGQLSTVPADEFELKEGVYRTFIFRDAADDGDIKKGNPMRSQVLEVTLVNNRKDDSPLYDAAVIYHQSHYSK